MIEKDYKLYGTKILNLKTQEIGLLICLWENKYADKTVDCLGFLPRSQKSSSQLASIKPANAITLNLIISEGLKMIFTKRTVKTKPKLVSLYLKWSEAK